MAKCDARDWLYFKAFCRNEQNVRTSPAFPQQQLYLKRVNYCPRHARVGAPHAINMIVVNTVKSAFSSLHVSKITFLLPTKCRNSKMLILYHSLNYLKSKICGKLSKSHTNKPVYAPFCGELMNN